MTPPPAHVAGVPVEEAVLAIATAGIATVSLITVVARDRVRGVVEWLRHR